ncbi:MAG: hypothetical protein KAS35_03510 [Candidatus Marinimicrobia bacterium]|nr:hypothetical protein [Candidatus Neomarinimicrobiota bacterium]
MVYLLPNISFRNIVSEPSNPYEIDLVKQWLNISPGTNINTVNSGNITIINTGKRNKHEGLDIKDAILIINDYQNYCEIWNQLKLPNIYRKFTKRFGTIIQSSQLKSFSKLQGLIAIDNNWCSKNLCHLCPLKEKNYVVS